MTRDSDEMDVKPSAPRIKVSPQAQFALVLYIVFPLLAGFVSAMQGSGRTSGWPLAYRIAYYIPLALVVMWSSGLSCWLLSYPVKALRLPLWMLLTLGSLVAGEIIKFYVEFIVPVFDKLLPSTVSGGRVVEFTLSGNLQAGIPTIITWVGINMVAWYVFGVDRFGYSAPKTARAARWFSLESTQDHSDASLPSTGERVMDLPNFMRRANLVSISQVEAIEAQQHYIKIHTNQGSKTILYRFSDAINEIGEEHGIRVHRSWWVNKKAVQSAQDKQGRLTLVLASGTVVPVSRTYHLRASEVFASDLQGP